jgi:hypothetical protein
MFGMTFEGIGSATTTGWSTVVLLSSADMREHRIASGQLLEVRDLAVTPCSFDFVVSLVILPCACLLLPFSFQCCTLCMCWTLVTSDFRSSLQISNSKAGQEHVGDRDLSTLESSFSRFFRIQICRSQHATQIV